MQYNNNVPLVIGELEKWVRTKKTRSYIPPAFYDRDGSFVQPPTFEMPAFRQKNSKTWLETSTRSELIDNAKQLG